MRSPTRELDAAAAQAARSSLRGGWARARWWPPRSAAGRGLRRAAARAAAPRRGARSAQPFGRRSGPRPRSWSTRRSTGDEADVPLRRSVDPEQTHSIIHTSGTSGRPQRRGAQLANHRRQRAGLGREPGGRGGRPLALPCCRSSTSAGWRSCRARRSTAPRPCCTSASTPSACATRLAGRGGHACVAGADDARAAARRGPRARAGAAARRPAGRRADPGRAARMGARGRTPGIAHLRDDRDRLAGRDRAARRAQRAAAARRRARASATTARSSCAGRWWRRALSGPDGWLHTGDRGRLDAEGRLHVDGRIKEIIVTGGENVSPVEVEEALLSHPAVADAGVAGCPTRSGGRR